MFKAAAYLYKVANRSWQKGPHLNIGNLFFHGPAVGGGRPALPAQGQDFGAASWFK